MELSRDFATRLYRILPWLERMYKNACVPLLAGGQILPRDCQLFQLKTDLAVGGTATAYLVLYDGTTDYTTTIEVIDVLGCYAGLGRDNVSGGGNGSFGWLVPGQSPRQIVAMGQAAGESCSLTLTGSDSTGSGVVSTAKGNLALALVAGTPAFSVSAGSLVIARPGTYILDLDISCAALHGHAHLRLGGFYGLPGGRGGGLAGVAFPLDAGRHGRPAHGERRDGRRRGPRGRAFHDRGRGRAGLRDLPGPGLRGAGGVLDRRREPGAARSDRLRLPRGAAGAVTQSGPVTYPTGDNPESRVSRDSARSCHVSAGTPLFGDAAKFASATGIANPPSSVRL